MNNPYTIYIEHTYSGQYAPQGYIAPQKEGWDIWIKDDGMLLFLGWVPIDGLYNTLLYYIEQDSCDVSVLLPNTDRWIHITPEFMHKLSTEIE